MDFKRHSDYIKHHGILLVISSPSGAGKTTITRLLLEREKYVTLSISATTRPPRPGEIHGEHYYFYSEAEFQKMVAEDAFMEYANVFGNWYGTLKKHVQMDLERGYDVIFDIDWQGAQKIFQEKPQRVVSVFILPPSLPALEGRLVSRAQDSSAVIEKRMGEAFAEMSHWAEYDYVIVNDDIEKAIGDIRSILRSERLKRTRQMGLNDFIQSLKYTHEK